MKSLSSPPSSSRPTGPTLHSRFSLPHHLPASLGPPGLGAAGRGSRGGTGGEGTGKERGWLRSSRGCCALGRAKGAPWGLLQA